jgi:PAS domain S-box-containing protein
MDSFERYAKLTLDNLPELLSWLSADLRYTWVNSKYAEYYGTTTEKIVGRHVSELLGEEQLRRTVEGEHGRALRGETVTTQEWKDPRQATPC